MNNIKRDLHDTISLRILDEINRESSITQRTIASRLNIALGLVNTYIKRLAKKGHIKITKGPMKRVIYALTPKGFAHRIELTYHYMRSSINYFREARQRIDDVYREMSMDGVRTILIWGDGEVAELAYMSLRGLPLKLVGVIDDEDQNNDFFGHNIYSFKEISKLNYDAILIASFDEEEVRRISELGIDKKKVYLL